jgi:hypothetical protein
MMSNRLPRRTPKKTQIDTDKIGKLIRMLGSDKAGEQLATVEALQRYLRASGSDFHDIAAIVQAGLRPAHGKALQRSWGPPAPRGDDWQEMCWYAHFHRHQLHREDREYVADCLLGVAFRDDDDVCTPWHMARLRRIVAGLKRATQRPRVEIEDEPF